jgi:predicted Zn-dependent protease with MMP-like domain
MLRLSRKAFEEAVAEALDRIPDELAELLDNVVVQVEDEPTAEELRLVGLDPEVDTLFGLYHGVSRPERGPGSYGGDLPDRVVVYRLPLLEHCTSRRELLREIRDTVIHEVGHYFGFDEEDLP